MKDSFEDKMKGEAEKYQALKDKGKDINELGKNQLKEIDQVHVVRSHDLSEYYKGRIQDKQDELLKVKKGYHGTHTIRQNQIWNAN